MPAVISSAASSTEANSSNLASFAIDSDDNTKWTASTNTGWLRLTLSSTFAVTEYRITPSPAQPTFAPKTWTFEGTNDGTFASWTTLDTRTNFTSWTSAASPTFTFSNTTAYLYYRLNVTVANGGASLAVAELRLTGATGIGLLGGNGGTMVEYYRASTITGRSNGDTVAFGDMTDQVGFHNFTNAVGTTVYRPTGAPNSLPSLEHASGAGSGFYRSTSSQKPTGDVTIFVVGALGSTVNQQLFGGGAGGAAVDVNSSKFRMMRQGQAQLAASTTNHPTSSTWFILIVTYTSSSGSTKFRIVTSGADTTDTISGSTSTFASTSSNIAWGLFDTSTSASMRGSLAEMGRYASVLDSTDLGTLKDTLYNRYFAPPSLDATFTVTASVTATGVVARSTDASLAATATITAAGTTAIIYTGTASVTTTATITAAGLVAADVTGTATRTVTATITAAGTSGYGSTATLAVSATITAAGTADLNTTLTGWTTDVSQQATLGFDIPAGVLRVTAPLATAPAWMGVVPLQIVGDPITPLTVDGDGRVHSDGT